MADACGGASKTCCGSNAALEPTAPKAVPAARCSTGDACGCAGGVPVFDGLDPRYTRVLWTVIGLNATMFVVEMVMGQLAGSQARGQLSD